MMKRTALVVAIGMAMPVCAVELGLYDTGGASATPLSGDQVMTQAGWTRIEEGQKPARFKGDVVLWNSSVAVVFRQKGSGAEVYGISRGGSATHSAPAVALRARLAPLLGESRAAPEAIASVRSVANEEDVAAVEVAFKGAAGTAGCVTYSLQPASPMCKSTPGAGVRGQRTEAPCRLGVLPDFFADDMVVDARAIPIARAEIPGENFFMHMTDGGDAMVTVIWDKGDGDMHLTLAGESEQRCFTGSEVAYGEGGSIWAAVLDEKGIWGAGNIDTNNVRNETTLEWQPPFVAKWKGNFTRADRTIDSWEFQYNPGDRRRWSGVGGGYLIPCWFEGKAPAIKARIQPATTFPNGRFSGPFVAYPIARDVETPLDRMTITDLMRNSLGVGPCEYITDVAGQGASNKGLFTCAVADMTPAFFRGNRQKEERIFIRNMLEQTQVFVKVIGDRINSYVGFRQDLLKYLAEQKMAHPELSDFIGRLDAQTKAIHGSKVDASAQVSNVVARINAMALADRPRSAERADLAYRLTEEGQDGSIASVGGWQDGVVARCRNSVKMLRQTATIEMAVNPAAAEVSKEVRRRTQQALRGALGHEM